MQNTFSSERIYDTAIYLRISKEDLNAAQVGRESNSITNQKQLILDYLKDKPEFNIVSIRIDDGYTGTNYDRPAFQQMLDDIRAGRVNCVVVKDLSRFGREYINAGKYIHRLFPVLGVRLIAINDRVDTITFDENSEMSITLKNLMNDNYSRDISVKTRTQLEVKRRHGEYTGSYTPYGYRKCADNHNKLEPDPYAALVVKNIFALKVDGYSNAAIAQKLNDQHILSPMEYKQSVGTNYYSGFKTKEKSLWSSIAIARILSNPVYIGTLRQGLRRRPNYKLKRPVMVDERDWVVVEGTHEAIIDEHTFRLTARIAALDTRCSPRTPKVGPLSGLLECGECHSSVVKYGYKAITRYRCSSVMTDSKCGLGTIDGETLLKAVLDTLREHIKLITEMDRCLEEIKKAPYQKANIAHCEERRDVFNQELNRYRSLKASLYEDLKDGVINREDFSAIRAEYDKRIADILISLDQIERELDVFMSGSGSPNQWMQDFLRHKDLKELTRAVAVECIEKVIVHKDNCITIVFTHAQDFARLQSALCEYQEAQLRKEA